MSLSAEVTKIGEAMRHIDLALTADLAGDGHLWKIEWYHRGPFQSDVPHQPSEYFRGIAVRGLEADSPVLVQWEASPTTIVTFYPDLNGLWAVPESASMLITVGVQYGGSVVDLYVLRFREGKLQRVGDMGGREVRIERLGSRQRFAVLVQVEYKDVPELYAWNGSRVSRADREFPEFWSKVAAEYLTTLRTRPPDIEAVPPYVYVDSCKRAIKVFDFAQMPERSREFCLEMRTLISEGHRLSPSVSKESPEQFKREKETALQEIDALVARLKSPE